MPKSRTYPILYDDLKTISISFLRKHGYLKPNQWHSGIITWSRNGNKTGSISIGVNTLTENPFLELDYTCNGTPVNYKVQFVTVPSNLGKGVVWFFVCPSTGIHCRKLYLADTYFYHRTAFRGCMYEKQTQSKKSRKFYSEFEMLFTSENIYDQFRSKNFMKFYNGKPTKKYIKLIYRLNYFSAIEKM